MRLRGALVVLVLLSLVAAPVAMAADGCSAMSSVCAASCAAPCVSASISASGPTLVLVASLTLPARARVPAAVLQVPDAPPKSLLFA